MKVLFLALVLSLPALAGGGGPVPLCQLTAVQADQSPGEWLCRTKDAVHPVRIINGTPVDPSDPLYQAVVRIQSNGAGCSASVIGPRVLITAAHCARTGAIAAFKYQGETYQATITRSPLYPRQDHDIALGVLDRDFPGQPVSVFQGELVVNDEVTLLGYGCTQPGGGGGNDGVLRRGDSQVTRLPQGSSYDVITRKSGGGALCYGDSGGPGFVKEDDGTFRIWGVNSKGNISTTNYNTYLRHQESVKFLEDFARSKAVEICGVNKDCGTAPPPPPPGDTFDFDGKVLAGRLRVKNGLDVDYVSRGLEMYDMYLDSGGTMAHPACLPGGAVSPMPVMP